MKIIKRDGRVVDYNPEKIKTAIKKANTEVKDEKQKATDSDIEGIISYIENQDKKRILVEDIQDIIEEKLMELGKYKLAKKYIVYRYKRALVRKSNTTDESILGIIRNESSELNSVNNNIMIASKQRDCIAGEVSKDLTNRLLLPAKIVKAHQDGILYFHNADYFIQPIFNSSILNIDDMLEKGTVMNGELIESPKSFQVACTIITQIMAISASNQYGGQSIDTKVLGKYLRRSYHKYRLQFETKYKGKLSGSTIDELTNECAQNELTAGVQSIQYQINTLMTTTGKNPYVTLFLHLDDNDQFEKENAMIIEEILKQMLEGVKDEDGNNATPKFPRLVYVLDKNNCLKGGKYDYLTKLAMKCTSKRKNPSYISAKKMRENYEGNVFSPMGYRDFLHCYKDEKGNYKFDGRFNQGLVTINLPQIALTSKNEEEFWKLLDERLDLCKEALMCRHYALLGITSDMSPIHWQYGGISRLKKGEKIDELLYNGYSTISLGYIGMAEMTKAIKNTSISTKEGHQFAIEVIKYLRKKTQEWSDESNIEFCLYGTPVGSASRELAKIDNNKFGNIKGITDKGYYTDSFHIEENMEINLIEKLKLESEFLDVSLGGGVVQINVPNIEHNMLEIETLIKYAYENVQHLEIR